MQKHIHSFIRHGHGGQLHAASLQYNIPLPNWIDLSTGINPFPYPLPPVPAQCWQRLPEINDGLEIAAARYYGSDHLLPVAGSQEAIQHLPIVRLGLQLGKQRIGIISPAYHSHRQAWENAGHAVIELLSSEVDQQLSNLDVLIVVNPNNPTTEFFSTKQLQSWHLQLATRGGWLIIDEAYMDVTPAETMIRSQPKPGLIILRSIGKFFGLAGIRLGFVWAETGLLQLLAEHQDDWAVSHPARWAGKLALQDNHWQKAQCKHLKQLSHRLALLCEAQFQNTKSKVSSTALFVYLSHPQAPYIHQRLAEKGILTRLFTSENSSGNHNPHTSPSALRIGLPAKEQHWEALENSLRDALEDLIENTDRTKSPF